MTLDSKPVKAFGAPDTDNEDSDDDGSVNNDDGSDGADRENSVGLGAGEKEKKTKLGRGMFARSAWSGIMV